MGSFAANNITTWGGGYDFTGDMNQTALALSYDALECTPFQPGTVTTPARVRIAGMETVQLDKAGFWEAGAGKVDPTAFTALGGSVQPFSQSPDGLESSAAYLFRAREFRYETFGEIGAVMPFRLSAQSARTGSTASTGAVRGRVLKTKANVSTTGATGTAQQLGAVGAGQFLYAAFHVFGVGTTITATLQSAPDNTFASPTTRMTFGPITAIGGTWGVRVAGAISDPWYRLNVTAVTGTFSIACTAGFR